MEFQVDKDAPMPLYVQIFQRIFEKIQDGSLEPRTLLPAEETLAEKIGVHRFTVRHAYKMLEEKGLVTRFRAKGTYVRSVPPGNNKLIALLGPALVRGSNLDMIQDMVGLLYKKGYNVLLCDTMSDFSRQHNYIEMIIDKMASGVIFIPIENNELYHKNLESINILKRKGIPVIQLDRYVDAENTDYIVTDNERGAYILTKYLLKKGHKRIGFIKSALSSSMLDRLKGYQQALIEYGIKPDDNLIKFFSELGANNTVMVDFFLKMEDPPTALFIIFDFIAVFTVNSLKEKGVKVPDDMEIVCFDNFWTSVFHIPVTSMVKPWAEMAERAIELLLKRIEYGTIEEPINMVLESKLVGGNVAELNNQA